MVNTRAAAQAVVDTLTNIDYMSVVKFSTDASSENTYLVPAAASHRAKTKEAIENVSFFPVTHITHDGRSFLSTRSPSPLPDRGEGPDLLHESYGVGVRWVLDFTSLSHIEMPGSIQRFTVT